jgi:hypothetical protein
VPSRSPENTSSTGDSTVVNTSSTAKKVVSWCVPAGAGPELSVVYVILEP